MKHWKQYILIVIGVVAVSALLTTTANCTDKKKAARAEQRLSNKDLPPAVLTAFQGAYPKAKIKGVDKETDSTTVFYEIESTDNGMKRTVIYKADGTLSEVEEEIAPVGLPEAARRTIEKDYSKGKLRKAEKVTRGGVTTFEALIVTDETYTEIVFDAAGKVVSSEEIPADEYEQD